jgi:Uma2 family endonuclease
MNAIPLEREVEYPTSDGQPMAETLEHQQVMIDLIEGLRHRFAGVPGAWVAGNFFLCYERGNPRAHLAPDVMVAKGLDQRFRPNYLLWEEKPPSLIVEVTSRSTRREDLGKKKSLYERFGTEEYVLYDPLDEYLKPRLQGYRLDRGRFQPIPLEADGSLRTRTTGLTFRPEGQRMRLVDSLTGKPILWHEESLAALQDAQERLRALEAELSRLRQR